MPEEVVDVEDGGFTKVRLGALRQDEDDEDGDKGFLVAEIIYNIAWYDGGNKR